MPRNLTGASTTTTAAASGSGVSELADLSDWDAFNAANTTALAGKATTSAVATNTSAISTLDTEKLDADKLVRIDSSATGRIMISGGSGTVLDSDTDVTSVINTGAGAQTKSGNLTLSGNVQVGSLEVSDADHQIQLHADGHMLLRVPTGDEFRFVVDGTDAAVLSATTLTIAGQTVATQSYVTSTLTSAETAASTVGLIEATPLTLAQALTCNNNVTLGDASSDTVTCNGTPTFNTDINLSTSSDIVRGSINVMERLTELHTDWRYTVTLYGANVGPSVVATLFSTATSFTRYEYGVSTPVPPTLSLPMR